MYHAQHTQTGETTPSFVSVWDALQATEDRGWEDVEVELIEVHNGNGHPAEFPCHYYSDYTCELTANRPDSLCPFHAGEED